MVNKNRNVITINLQGDIGEIFRDRELFIYQYDDGQELYFPDYEELGISEVQFANENSGEAIRREMTDGYVQIPYALLSQNRPIFAYVMCITSDSTTTMIKLIIQNNCRVIAEDAIDPEDEQTFREWVQEQIDGKQDALIAGENITIEGNVISATGGGRVNELDDLADVDVAGATDGQILGYDAENEEWKNVDGMTESRVNLLIDNKLIPFSKVYTAEPIMYTRPSLGLTIQINATLDRTNPFKNTDLVILKMTGVTIPSDWTPRFIDVIDNTELSAGVRYTLDTFEPMIDGNNYLLRFIDGTPTGSVDILSSTIITAEQVDGLTTLLNAKQNTLTAGSGITIVNDVISATGGGGGVDELSELTDVAISSPINKQTLKYDSITQKWVNVTDDLTGLSDVTLNSPSNGQVLKYNSTSQKWENANESGGSGSGHNAYTGYYLSQAGQKINIVINEADDSSFTVESGDIIILPSFGQGETLSNTKPTSIQFYANDEETTIGATPPLTIEEQFIAGKNYMLFNDNGGYASMSTNVTTVAQVNALIDAKINALGNAEQEEF